MRAITYSRTGDPDVLTLVAKPMQEPGPGEVRVRVHRSGVNPTDWKSRRGNQPGDAVDPPQTPGQDGAGVIDQVGPSDVAALQRGQRVWVWEAGYQRPEGTAQEYAIVPARQVQPLPEAASFDLGAALGIPFLTAHRCLTVAEDGPDRLGPGRLRDRVVLVAGGAGAVGNAAIQLARWSAATIITTVSSAEKADLARRAGAEHVIDYRREDVVAEVRKIAPNGVHAIIEVSPGPNAQINAAVIARHGCVAVYANNGGPTVTLPIRDFMTPNARWQFVLVYTAPREAKIRAVADVSDALGQGVIRVGAEAGLPLHHFALSDAAKAHAAVEDGIVGKVLIDI